MEQMEEVQREAKVCKSCSPFTKLNIPNIWKKENYLKTNKTTKHVHTLINGLTDILYEINYCHVTLNG